MKKNYVKDLMEFIDVSHSQFQACNITEKRLEENGYKRLDKAKKWQLEKGGKYFITNNSSAFIAFEIGSESPVENGFRIIGSHTDSPTFRVKPLPEMGVEGKYLKLNTEMYGGAIISTWFDRPLSLAGRVSLKGKDVLNPEIRLLDIDKDILVIPNLCIHQNREVNDGLKYNKQEDILPLLSTINENFEKDGFLLKLIADELSVNVEDILDFELYLYLREKSSIIGLNDEFISAPKLENLAMVHASLIGLLESASTPFTKLIVANDNEEVGSTSKQGANSPMLKNVLERIVLAMGGDREDYHRAISKSFIISADMAHALHPNYTGKADPTNRPIMNSGPTIKIAASGSYTSDAHSISVYKAICDKLGLNCQTFVNRSDMRGGSTIGPITSKQIDIASIDIGNPILSMHSSRELGGVKDHEDIIKTFIEYFNK